MKNKLEQIFWRKGKFVISKDKEVDPKEIAELPIVQLNYPFQYDEIARKLEELPSKKNIKNSPEINAYMIGSEVEACYSFIAEPCLEYFTLGFYKIWSFT